MSIDLTIEPTVTMFSASKSGWERVEVPHNDLKFVALGEKYAFCVGDVISEAEGKDWQSLEQTLRIWRDNLDCAADADAAENIIASGTHRLRIDDKVYTKSVHGIAVEGLGSARSTGFNPRLLTSSDRRELALELLDRKRWIDIHA